MRLPSVLSRSAAATLPLATPSVRNLSMRPSPFCSTASFDLEHDRLEAGRRRHLRDARAHQPAPEHADCLDRHVAAESRPPTTDSRQSRQCPDRRRCTPSPGRTSCRGAAVRCVSVSSSRVPLIAERMAERDRAAVDVDLVAIEAELLFDREILPGKRFVHLDQIDVGRASVRRDRAPCASPAPGPCP